MVGTQSNSTLKTCGIFHKIFYEGMCQNLIWGTLATLEQLQSQITMVTELCQSVSEWVSQSNFCGIFHKFLKFNFSGFRPLNRFNFFFHGSVCVSFTWLTPCHVHVPFYEGMCQNLLIATGGTLEQLQSGITMASDDRIDSNFQRARR